MKQINLKSIRKQPKLCNLVDKDLSIEGLNNLIEYYIENNLDLNELGISNKNEVDMTKLFINKTVLIVCRSLTTLASYDLDFESSNNVFVCYVYDDCKTREKLELAGQKVLSVYNQEIFSKQYDEVHIYDNYTWAFLLKNNLNYIDSKLFDGDISKDDLIIGAKLIEK